VIVLALAATSLQAADPDLDALLARLARPAPDSTSFVEIRYSSLLDVPIVVSGLLEHRADGALVRRVESPYQEVTELKGGNVTVQRANGRLRRFSLDRAPELRGMLASFGALLTGDRQMLEQFFAITLQGNDARWEMTLTPRDGKLKKRLSTILIDGAGDRPRCFTLHEPDGDEGLMALGVAGPDELPVPPERQVVEAWCNGSAGD
jgi:hypothetical protein